HRARLRERFLILRSDLFAKQATATTGRPELNSETASAWRSKIPEGVFGEDPGYRDFVGSVRPKRFPYEATNQKRLRGLPTDEKQLRPALERESSGKTLHDRPPHGESLKTQDNSFFRQIPRVNERYILQKHGKPSRTFGELEES